MYRSQKRRFLGATELERRHQESKLKTSPHFSAVINMNCKKFYGTVKLGEEKLGVEEEMVFFYMYTEIERIRENIKAGWSAYSSSFKSLSKSFGTDQMQVMSYY